MRYGSVCSGIEAATVAWHPLGWEPAFFSEIEAAPKAVLAHHWPGVPCHGDFTTIQGDEYGPIDLLVGGTPCQDFSVAGLRAGLDGDRGNLSLEFLRLADRTRPRWVVWENVPGVLSIDGGRAFGAILGGLGELGYGFAYRILDAQFFGVPQRRRRVFVVGCLGNWRGAAAVLSERHSLSGHPAPRREAGPRSAGRIARSLAIRGREGHSSAELGDELANAILTPSGGRAGVGVGAALIEAFGGGNTSGAIDVATAQTAHGVRLDFDTETFVAHSLRAEGFDASEDGTGRGTPLVPVPYSIMPMNSGRDYVARPVAVAQPLMAGGPAGGNQGGDFIVQPLAFDCTAGGDTGFAIGPVAGALRVGGRSTGHAAVAFDMRGREGGAQFEGPHDTANIRAAPGGSSRSYVATSAVRRLTPRECERLQGFPDDYTLVPHRGKPMADGPRYKALGNSMAVPVMRWIGERIAAVDALMTERTAA